MIHNTREGGMGGAIPSVSQTPAFWNTKPLKADARKGIHIRLLSYAI